MMPIMGKRMTGSRAVTASGMHSVHQYSAMSMMTKPHFASCNEKQGIGIINSLLTHDELRVTHTHTHTHTHIEKCVKHTVNLG